MAKNKKDFYSEEEVERRKREHNCTGYCYGYRTDLPKDHPDRLEMCHNAEFCPETCVKEFWITVFASIEYLLFLNPVAWIIWLLIIEYLTSK